MDPAPPAAAPADPSARLGAAIAGAGGVLLFISLFLTWYKLPGADLGSGAVGDIVDDVGGAIGFDVNTQEALTRNAWEAFEITDMVAVIASIVAVARAGVAIFGPDDNPSIPGSLLTLAIGGVALALILYRTVNPPYVGLDIEFGLWVGILGAGSIVYGSYQAMRSEPPPAAPAA